MLCLEKETTMERQWSCRGTGWYNSGEGIARRGPATRAFSRFSWLLLSYVVLQHCQESSINSCEYKGRLGRKSMFSRTNLFVTPSDRFLCDNSRRVNSTVRLNTVVMFALDFIRKDFVEGTKEMFSRSRRRRWITRKGNSTLTWCIAELPGEALPSFELMNWKKNWKLLYLKKLFHVNFLLKLNFEYTPSIFHIFFVYVIT